MIDYIRLHFKFETIVSQLHVREANFLEPVVGLGVRQIMGNVREPGAAGLEPLNDGKGLFHGLVHGMGNVPQRVEDEYVEIFQQGHRRVWNFAEISEISGTAEAEAENFHVSMEQSDGNRRYAQKLRRAPGGVPRYAWHGAERRFVIEG